MALARHRHRHQHKQWRQCQLPSLSHLLRLLHLHRQLPSLCPELRLPREPLSSRVILNGSLSPRLKCPWPRNDLQAKWSTKLLQSRKNHRLPSHKQARLKGLRCPIGPCLWAPTWVLLLLLHLRVQNTKLQDRVSMFQVIRRRLEARSTARTGRKSSPRNTCPTPPCRLW